MIKIQNVNDAAYKRFGKVITDYRQWKQLRVRMM